MTVTARQVMETCAGCQVVLAVYPDGENFEIVRGRDVLAEIGAGRDSRKVKMAHVAAADYFDAQRIRALLQAN
jgi:hypothetical protein